MDFISYFFELQWYYKLSPWLYRWRVLPCLWTLYRSTWDFDGAHMIPIMYSANSFLLKLGRARTQSPCGPVPNLLWDRKTTSDFLEVRRYGLWNTSYSIGDKIWLFWVFSHDKTAKIAYRGPYLLTSKKSEGVFELCNAITLQPCSATM